MHSDGSGPDAFSLCCSSPKQGCYAGSIVMPSLELDELHGSFSRLSGDCRDRGLRLNHRVALILSFHSFMNRIMSQH